MPKSFRWLFSVLPVILVACSSNINWGNSRWKTIIVSDAKGYYAYLPAIFIYHDLNFGFFDRIEKQKYPDPNNYYDYRAGHNGKTLDKYFCGTAVAQLPFFLIAHGLTRITGGDADGYSALYPIGINIAAIFYCLLGLYFLAKTLAFYIHNNKIIFFIIAVALFGTNLFYYTVIECGMSHVYSFALICIFGFCIKRWFSGGNNRLLAAASLVLGMIILIRPVNALVVFSIPFLAGSKPELFRLFHFIRTKFNSVLLFAFLCFLPLSIQLIIYKIQAGSFFIYSYGNEGFDFADPNIFNILFSFKKGLFLYTPVYLASFAGLIYFFRENRYQLYSFLLFFLLLTYVLSCWTNWWYGGSFSSRVYVEYLLFFMIPLAVATERMANRIKQIIFIPLLFLLVLLCQVQTYQYRYYQIHWENMTMEKYGDVFLRIDRLKK